MAHAVIAPVGSLGQHRNTLAVYIALRPELANEWHGFERRGAVGHFHDLQRDLASVFALASRPKGRVGTLLPSERVSDVAPQ